MGEYEIACFRQKLPNRLAKLSKLRGCFLSLLRLRNRIHDEKFIFNAELDPKFMLNTFVICLYTLGSLIRMRGQCCTERKIILIQDNYLLGGY